MDGTSRLRQSRGSGGITLHSVLFLVLLVAAPAYAGTRLTSMIDWRVLLGLPLLLSVFAFFAYQRDKRRAEAGKWRIPEWTLHIMGFLGGWPGAFLAQRQFRHKTSKVSFQATFWIIVVAYQFLAIDSLTGWQLSKDALRFLRSL